MALSPALDTPGFQLEAFLDELRAPISGSAEGSGADLERRPDSDFHKIENWIETTYRVALRHADDRREATQAINWSEAVAACRRLLGKEAKDLRLAVWMAKALGMAHDLPGILAGLRIVCALHESFWEPMYPKVDLARRAKWIRWLSDQLDQDLRHAPLCPLEGTFGYALVDGSDKELQRRAMGECDPARLAAALACCKEIRLALAELSRHAERSYGEHLPSLRGAREAVDGCLQHLSMMVAPGTDEGAAGAAATAAAPSSAAAAAASPRGRARGGPASRQEALEMLGSIATYFREMEPLSPIPYLIQRALRWGEQPLTEWLREVIDKREVLQQVFTTLGISEAEGKK